MDGLLPDMCNLHALEAKVGVDVNQERFGLTLWQHSVLVIPIKQMKTSDLFNGVRATNLLWYIPIP